MSDSIIHVDGLTKLYGRFAALKDCDLQVDRGCIFGLLGPNGAGKTTLIRTLLGYLRPSSGRAFIDGLDCILQSVTVRGRVAYLPAEAKLFRMMRGREVLEFFASMHPLGSYDRAVKLADRLMLPLTRRVAFMSTGMRQKLAIASVLSCHAPLLILDEPTANLDPTIRSEVLQLLGEAKATGRTILFSSHVLSEIEEVCDHAAILRDGAVVKQVDIHNLRSVHRVRFSYSSSAGATAQDVNDGQATPTASPISAFVASLPADIILIDRTDLELVLEISGPLENHMGWLASLRPHALRIEPVGLRSIYDGFKSTSNDKPQEPA